MCTTITSKLIKWILMFLKIYLWCHHGKTYRNIQQIQRTWNAFIIKRIIFDFPTIEYNSDVHWHFSYSNTGGIQVFARGHWWRLRKPVEWSRSGLYRIAVCWHSLAGLLPQAHRSSLHSFEYLPEPVSGNEGEFRREDNNGTRVTLCGKGFNVKTIVRVRLYCQNVS